MVGRGLLQTSVVSSVNWYCSTLVFEPLPVRHPRRVLTRLVSGQNSPQVWVHPWVGYWALVGSGKILVAHIGLAWVLKVMGLVGFLTQLAAHATVELTDVESIVRTWYEIICSGWFRINFVTQPVPDFRSVVHHSYRRTPRVLIAHRIVIYLSEFPQTMEKTRLSINPCLRQACFSTLGIYGRSFQHNIATARLRRYCRQYNCSFRRDISDLPDAVRAKLPFSAKRWVKWFY